MLQSIIIKLISIPFIFACLTVHECAHGYVAYLLGDNTAKESGRLTLNPLAHIDWLGAAAMLLVGFGWAKPVPVNPYRFKKGGARGIVWVSLAGPVSNLIFAFIIVFVYGILYYTVPAIRMGIGSHWGMYVRLIAQSWASLNVGLAVFNLVPIPPLDGSKVLMYFLPYNASAWMEQNQNTLYLGLMLLTFAGFLNKIITPVISYTLSLIYHGADLLLFFVK